MLRDLLLQEYTPQGMHRASEIDVCQDQEHLQRPEAADELLQLDAPRSVLVKCVESLL